MSRRSLILAKVEELLGADARPEGLNVHRSRTRPLDRDQLPASIPYPLREEATTDDHAAAVLRTLTFRVEHRIRTPGDHPTALATPPDDVLDPLLVWTTAALLADPTLGGLAEDLEEVGTVWAFEEAEQILGAAGQDFTVAFWTAPADQDAAP